MDTGIEGSTYVWGSDAWEIIHGLSFYPGDSETFLTETYIALLRTLPCGGCRLHAKDNFKLAEFTAALKSDTLVEFWHAFHDKVNQQTKKTTIFNIDDLCLKYALRGSKVVPQEVVARYARAQWILTPRSLFNAKELATLWLKLIRHFKYPVTLPASPRPIDVLIALDPSTDLESLVGSMSLVDEDD